MVKKDLLNFLSQHSFTQKRGIIINLIDRIFLISPYVSQKNLELIVNIRLVNDYPLKFVYDTIYNRINQTSV